VPPKSVMPASFTEHIGSATGAAQGSPTPDDAWWENFGDATLDSLVADALSSAPDIAEAEARIREARALRGIAGAAQYPTADAGAEYDRTHGSANVPIGVPPGGLGPGANGNLWQTGFDASWEIDVFGGKRRSVESADAAYQATVADLGDVELTLVAEIARNYVELRGVQRQLAVARNNLSIQQDSAVADPLAIRRRARLAPRCAACTVAGLRYGGRDPDFRSERTRRHLSNWRTDRPSARTIARATGYA
jgi:multidrug efflux system outer membrane protein